ncbi:hypothetical protein [Pseudomonas sichuanensis]|uniref:hypothetical protein n=1 Tax=Pseudomonas sichuanensis TaxID=2213015 RepID=UPI000DA68937|nr:hypothetical protein [Pseudomonas sichuanensis]
MPQNDFLPFALGSGSNVMPQAEYAALGARGAGFSSGTAKSRELNKVWRQSAFAVSCVAQFMADYTGHDILDDGDEVAFKANLAKAISLLSMGTDYAVGANTGNAYTASFVPSVTALVDGMVLRFKAATANTGPATFSPNGLTAKPIVNLKYAALSAGDIAAGGEVWLQYNTSISGGSWVSILSLGLSSASTTVSGIVRIATASETQDGVSDSLGVSPSGLASQPLESARIDVASASTVNLTAAAPRTRHINITGTTAISAFTVAAGKHYFVRFDASLTLMNGAALVTQSGANITTAAGDTCELRATSANVVEVLCYTPGIPQELGYRQTWQNVLASRAINTTYTNNTGRTIWVMASINIAAGVAPLLVLDGTSSASVGNNGSGANIIMFSFPVKDGGTYRINSGTSAGYWSELR